MRNKIIQSLTTNPLLKAIATAIAVLIWLFVTNSNDPVDTQLFSNVEINIINQDSIADIGKVVEPIGNGTVTVKVTERKSVLRRLSRTGSDFYVEADLENINAMDSVPLTVTCANSAVTWDEMEMNPSSLKVTLENKVEQEFPITVAVSGSPASGFAVGTAAVAQGKTILVAGPESIINIISQVSASANVAALTEDTTLTSPLRVFDKNGAQLTDSQMSRLEFKDSSGAFLTEGTVNVRVTIWKVRSDVIIRAETSGEPAEGYQITKMELIPSTTSLAGTQDALDEIGRYLLLNEAIDVGGAADNIRVELDLADTVSDYTNLRLLDTENSTVSIEVEISKSGDHTYQVPLGTIETQNWPKEMKLVFTPADNIPISVHAIDENAPLLEPEDIQASMDLSECREEGIYTIPVEIVLPEGYELNREVTVTVSSASQATSSENDSNMAEGEQELESE